MVATGSNKTLPKMGGLSSVQAREGRTGQMPSVVTVIVLPNACPQLAICQEFHLLSSCGFWQHLYKIRKPDSGGAHL